MHVFVYSFIYFFINWPSQIFSVLLTLSFAQKLFTLSDIRFLFGHSIICRKSTTLSVTCFTLVQSVSCTVVNHTLCHLFNTRSVSQLHSSQPYCLSPVFYSGIKSAALSQVSAVSVIYSLPPQHAGSCNPFCSSMLLQGSFSMSLIRVAIYIVL
jgi:hypothetical protein